MFPTPVRAASKPTKFQPGLEALEERTLLNAGGLDTTFSGDGKLSNNFAGGVDVIQAVALQDDGKIVVAGYATFPGNEKNIALARYLPNGDLDSTFGLNNSGMIDLGPSTSAYTINDVAVDPATGKIVMAGRFDDLNEDLFMVVRCLPNGQLDNTFDNDGFKSVFFGAGVDAEANAVTLHNGKIIVGGSVLNGFHDFALVRLLDNGDMDNTFGTLGKVIQDFNNQDDVIFDLAMQGDKIVVAGRTAFGSSMDFALARYTANGALDNSFGVLGKQVTDFNGNLDEAKAVAIGPGGQIAVGGYSTGGSGDFALALYTADGVLDSSKVGNGKVVTDFDGGVDRLEGVAFQADGKIVAVGLADVNGAHMGVARYNADGSLDAGFGQGGKVAVQVNGTASYANGVAIQPDGKIVAAGYTDTAGGDFAVIRLDGVDTNPNPGNDAVSDVTTQVSVVKSKVRRTRRLGRFKQLVVVTNTGNAAIQGPLHLVLDGLKKKVKLRASNGLTQKQGPLGSPSRILIPGGDNILSSGESVAVMLVFRSPTMKQIKYATRVLAGGGAI